LLQSVKVLSFTHFLQGPKAAQLLGDLGADVIKIESLSGAFERQWSGCNAYLNGVSINFLLGNRNERSLSVNLKTEEGKEIVYKLAKEADVIIENYRPGVMDRLGFGYENIKKINPSIVYCSCSGFGTTGPYKDRPGQDLLAQAMSGLMTLSGRKSDPPIAIGAPVVDLHAAVLAATGILAALYERKATGKGKKVESNLLDAALDLQTEPFNIHLNGFPLYEKSESGISSRCGQAPYGVFKTADDYICLSMTSLDKLAAIFEDETFLQWADEGQFARREEINRKVAEHMPTNTNEYWIKKFEKHGAWYSVINTYDDVEKDPQVEWNGNIQEFEHPVAGNVRLLSNPVRYDGKRLELKKTPPGLGEHTEEILKEIGYDEEAIERLVDKSVVKNG